MCIASAIIIIYKSSATTKCERHFSEKTEIGVDVSYDIRPTEEVRKEDVNEDDTLELYDLEGKVLNLIEERDEEMVISTQDIFNSGEGQ